jgi:hypothetical protein
MRSAAFLKMLDRPAIAVTVWVLLPAAADTYAVPSMGRQTGMPSASCHTVYPELTPFGRQFKLRGFSMSGPRARNRS